MVAWYRTKDRKQEKARLYANKKNALKAADREWKKIKVDGN